MDNIQNKTGVCGSNPQSPILASAVSFLASRTMLQDWGPKTSGLAAISCPACYALTTEDILSPCLRWLVLSLQIGTSYFNSEYPIR